MIFRISDVDKGSLESGAIEVKAIQDVFALGETVFSAPAVSGWTAPTTTASAVTDQALIEQPRFFHASDNTRVLAVARPVNTGQLAYNLFAKESTATDYVERARDVAYTPQGTLTG